MLYAPLSKDALKMYTQKDSFGIYRNKDFVFKNKSNNQNQKYGIKCPDGQIVYPPEGYIYRFIQESFQDALANQKVVFKKTSTTPLIDGDGNQANWNIYIKKYLGDGKGAPATIISQDFASLYNNGTQYLQELFDGNRVFDNAKPINLISYLIEILSDSDSIILDFFSGSATTADAVLRLNAKDGANRKFIMVQIPEACEEASTAFQSGYVTIAKIGIERIRRAGALIAKELSGGHVGTEPEDTSYEHILDNGFRLCKVDVSNYEEITQIPAASNQDLISGWTDNIKPDRTPLDLLFSVLGDLAISYSAHIETLPPEQFSGHEVFSVEDGYLVACFDENLDNATIEAMAQLQPSYCVVRDASFVDDAAAANFEELFKTFSHDTQLRVL